MQQNPCYLCRVPKGNEEERKRKGWIGSLTHVVTTYSTRVWHGVRVGVRAYNILQAFWADTCVGTYKVEGGRARSKGLFSLGNNKGLGKNCLSYSYIRVHTRKYYTGYLLVDINMAVKLPIVPSSNVNVSYSSGFIFDSSYILHSGFFIIRSLTNQAVV